MTSRGAAELLVILDGASEPPRAGLPTSLEAAVTPALDALCAAGSLSRVRTVARGLEAGSEHAIPALLGWVPPAPVDRGAVEAAARGIAVPEGCRAWRVDVRAAADGARADGAAVAGELQQRLDACALEVAARVDAAAAPGPEGVASAAAPEAGHHAVHALGGHRLLIVGPAPLPPLPVVSGLTLHHWPEGIVPPRLLDGRTVLIAAAGAAAGIARLLGARVVTPLGATGRPGSDLAAKARAAVEALDGDLPAKVRAAVEALDGDLPAKARAAVEALDASVAGAAGGPHRAARHDAASHDGVLRVVVHVGAPDEAAHELDRAAKVAALEAADRELIAPLAAAGFSTIRVCPDHGCDPLDGRHDAAPVPFLTWTAQDAPRSAQGERASGSNAPLFAQGEPASGTNAPRFAQGAPPRLTERAVADLPVVELAGARERERVAV